MHQIKLYKNKLRNLILLLTFVMVFGCMVACGNDSQAATVDTNDRVSSTAEEAETEEEDTEEVDTQQEDTQLSEETDPVITDPAEDFDFSAYFESYTHPEYVLDEMQYAEPKIVVCTFHIDSDDYYQLISDGDICQGTNNYGYFIYCPTEIEDVYEVDDKCYVGEWDSNGHYAFCPFEAGEEAELTIVINDVNGKQYSITFTYQSKE